MAAPFSDLSDVVNVRSGSTAEDIWCFVDPRVGSAAASAAVAGRFTSLWQYNKTPGGHGPTPSTSATRDNTSVGGMLQASPGGGLSKFLTGSGVISSQYGTYVLYDRLVDSGGLSGTTTTAQTTNLPTASLTRYTSGEGNFIFVEISTIIGTTATTATIEYTNQDGTTGRVTPAFAIGATGLREAQRFIIVPLQDGDTGVRSIENFDLLATTGTAGDIAVGIGHWIVPLPATNSGGCFLQDHLSGTVVCPEILEACIVPAFLAAATVAPSGLIMLFTGDK